MRVLAALHRFAEFGDGDVRTLAGREELRRLFFVTPTPDTIAIRRVLHRREAYR
jgi:hypothetical protein